MLPDLDQRFGGNAEPLVQPPDHIERELASTIQHFVRAISAADKGDQAARLQPPLLHVVSDRLDRVRQIERLMLSLP
jgi:hypothetical protein